MKRSTAIILALLMFATVAFQFGLAWFLIQINLEVLELTGMPHEGITGAMIGLLVGVGNTAVGMAIINYIQKIDPPNN